MTAHVEGDGPIGVAALQSALGDAFGGDIVVHGVTRISGGACQDNARVDLSAQGGGLDGITRLALRADALRSLPGSLPRRVEARVMTAAVERGVCTPAVRLQLDDQPRVGASTLLLDWAPGVALGRRVVAGPELEQARRHLPEALAEQLARIHSVRPEHVPGLFDDDWHGGKALGAADQRAASAALVAGDAVPHEVEAYGLTTAAPSTFFDRDPVYAALQAVQRQLGAFVEPHPALHIIVAWLERHAPRRSDVVLVHGDFRVGNFIVSPERGLEAVLDWEFAHFGAPEEDLAWIAVRDWRFGRLDRPVGGLCERARWCRAYEAAAGRRLDPEALHWWEVLGNARWAAGAVQQAERVLTGREDDLEFVAIGRRAAEMEWEALRLCRRGPPPIDA